MQAQHGGIKNITDLMFDLCGKFPKDSVTEIMRLGKPIQAYGSSDEGGSESASSICDSGIRGDIFERLWFGVGKVRIRN